MRVMGIEPMLPAWEADVLPLYDTRSFNFRVNSALSSAPVPYEIGFLWKS